MAGSSSIPPKSTRINSQISAGRLMADLQDATRHTFIVRPISTRGYSAPRRPRVFRGSDPGESPRAAATRPGSVAHALHEYLPREGHDTHDSEDDMVAHSEYRFRERRRHDAKPWSRAHSAEPGAGSALPDSTNPRALAHPGAQADAPCLACRSRVC